MTLNEADICCWTCRFYMHTVSALSRALKAWQVPWCLVAVANGGLDGGHTRAGLSEGSLPSAAVNVNEEECESPLATLSSSSSFPSPFSSSSFCSCSFISQGQRLRRPAHQLGLSELPKENHSAPFFLLHLLALSSLRGDTQRLLYLSVCVRPCLPQIHPVFPPHLYFSTTSLLPLCLIWPLRCVYLPKWTSCTCYPLVYFSVTVRDYQRSCLFSCCRVYCVAVAAC